MLGTLRLWMFGRGLVFAVIGLAIPFLIGCGSGGGIYTPLQTLDGDFRGDIGINELKLVLTQAADSTVTGSATLTGAGDRTYNGMVRGVNGVNGFTLSAELPTWGTLFLSGTQNDKRLSVQYERKRPDGTVIEGGTITLQIYVPPPPPDDNSRGGQNRRKTEGHEVQQ